jgi:hypothetical protein
MSPPEEGLGTGIVLALWLLLILCFPYTLLANAV